MKEKRSFAPVVAAILLLLLPVLNLGSEMTVEFQTDTLPFRHIAQALDLVIVCKIVVISWFTIPVNDVTRFAPFANDRSLIHRGVNVGFTK